MDSNIISTIRLVTPGICCHGYTSLCVCVCVGVCGENFQDLLSQHLSGIQHRVAMEVTRLGITPPELIQTGSVCEHLPFPPPPTRSPPTPATLEITDLPSISLSTFLFSSFRFRISLGIKLLQGH